MPDYLTRVLLHLSSLTFLYVLGSAGIWMAMSYTIVFIVPFLLAVAGICRVAPIAYDYVFTFGDEKDDKDSIEILSAKGA